MRRTVLFVLGALVLAVGAAGCFGGGSSRYEESGLDITFKVPGGFHIAHDIQVARTAGAQPADQAAVAIDTDNLIIVSRYNLSISVTASNLATVKGEVDKVVSSLARKKVSGNQVEYGGFPGYEYVIPVTNPPHAQSRMAVLFDQRVEYLVNCQSTITQRDKVAQGCRTVLDSLKHS
jgi:hypothetical protein